ncbi:hypothetical protein CLU79DRAFT_65268 [Phycomyces nitens]|nr:hypothetical protein CLU79DRAFT_65268 [Phycomyces nitens]
MDAKKIKESLEEPFDKARRHELKKTTEQTAPKEIHSHPDIKLWLTELQNTMPDLEQASIEELYPSKGRKDIDGFLKQYESIAIGFEYLMLFYYNEIVEPNLKRSNNMEEIQGWRERLKTSAKKRKLATWDILNSRRDAWANERNRMLGQRYLDYEQGDLLSEKEFLLDPEPEQPDIPKESAIKNEPSNDTCNSRLEEMEGAGSFDFDHI